MSKGWESITIYNVFSPLLSGGKWKANGTFVPGRVAAWMDRALKRRSKLKRSQVHLPGQWQASPSSSGQAREEIKRISEISQGISCHGFWWQPTAWLKEGEELAFANKTDTGLGMDRITHHWPWNDLYPPDTFVSCFERVLQQTKQINSGATKGSVNLISRNTITDFTLQWTSFLLRLSSSLHPSNKSSSQLENHLGFKVKVVLQMTNRLYFLIF